MNNPPLKTYVFYCSECLEPDQLVDPLGKLDGITVQAIGLPCVGKIDIPYLLKAFETGADGIVIVACSQNECLQVEGTVRTRKRAEAVESLLEEIGMGSGRIAFIELKEGSTEQVLSEIRDFFDSIKNLPRQKAQSTDSL